MLEETLIKPLKLIVWMCYSQNLLLVVVMENLHTSLQAECLPTGLSFASRESVEAELLVIHKNKWRENVEHVVLHLATPS